MPVVLAILALVGGAIWWWIRNNPRDAISAAQDAVTVARNAPRKIAFRRQTKEHPVQGVDDPRLAVATIAQAFMGLDDLPTKEARQRLHTALRQHYQLSAEDGEEMDTLARFLIQQCQGETEAISRVGRRLHNIDGQNSWDDLTEMLKAASGDTLSERQREAIHDLRVALKIRP
ncbi:hypothetical protein C8N43_2000 [Litoreibacter ponti]|uniref:Tellurite resistance protein TerB n=1 Tax=Litoreibacter ponti TaxID=1510457 RepID=A0A2T6BMM5_9RHOB|nr:hypothetical protein [Litoreibacter ponti]PTX57333.1 hypothetical protein C8N43_2000 [Litoreibacter ponti]